MKLKLFFVSLITGLSILSIQAQIDARMFRYPDVSKNQITFSYAGDIWIVPIEGGTAFKLSSPSGEESYPKFSPDGSKIAFNGNYNGNSDVYVMPSSGGIPERITYHGGPDNVIDWHPAGEKILFSSSRESGRQRFRQLYLISQIGGQAEKLPMAFAEFGSFSPDGKSIAFTDKSRITRTWKRYRGGTAPDIFIFNLEDYSSINITNNTANDEIPMWNDNNIFFMSDQGPNERNNIWVYDQETKQNKQLTHFKDFDVHFPSLGPGNLVFEAGGNLYLLNLSTFNQQQVNIKIVTDQLALIPKVKKVKDNLQSGRISPDGKRAIIEARGEVFSVPAEHGYVTNLTKTSGIAERFPAWSPDGKNIAFWSDQSGEYELTLLNLENNQEKKLTSYGAGFRYNLFWSPDSKKLAFIDQLSQIKIFNIENNTSIDVARDNWMGQGGLMNFSVSWSADSRWMAYTKSQTNGTDVIFLYDTKNNASYQVTSGFYSDTKPSFDPDGKYLYFLTNRHMQPVYSDMDWAFIYPKSTKIAAITLRKDVSSPLEARNDKVKIKEEEKAEDEEPEKNKKKNKKKDKKAENGDEKKDKSVEIDLDGLEERTVILPPKAGDYFGLQAVSGKILFQTVVEGGPKPSTPIKYYDLKEREEKTILANANFYDLSADGKKLLVLSNGTAAIIDVKPEQKMEKNLRLDEMEAFVNPRAEWEQIFTDAWRLERDYFYDENMHGVDWLGMREHYEKLLNDAVTRWDVNYVIGELIGEMNASHTYKGGGDTEKSLRNNTGYLGVDFMAENGYYKIKRIIKGAPWDAEVRSPLALPGVDVKEGEYILSVNGIPINTKTEPYAAFEGLAGKTVVLVVNQDPSMANAREVIVKTLSDESRLRHLEWMENNRKKVEKETNGKIGYIYVRSTGVDGQNELMRQFAGQWHKEGLIIDERFNSGGQIPDRFIELLNREPLAYAAVRGIEDMQIPYVGNYGPKAMLINGWSGSGGDAFPDFFRKKGLGPLIGSRTWGGLIGYSGVPSLIDGGYVTVPSFRFYDPDGKWFKEGHGVDPDIKVDENHTELAKGGDPQLEKAIEWINNQLKEKPYVKPVHEPFEKR